MPPVAAELAIGDRLQADGLLFPDCFPNAAVFDFRQLLFFQYPILEFLSCIRKLSGTEQAADLVGAERRCHRIGFNPRRATRCI